MVMIMAEKETERDVVERRRPLEQYWPRGPFHLMSDFDRMFDNFRREIDGLLFDPTARREHWRPQMVVRRGAFRTPVVNLKDTGQEFVLTAEFPGIPKDNIDISVTTDGIELKAAVEEETAEEDECYLCQERSYRSYHRKLEFPEEVSPDEVKASMKDGVLQVSIPKRQQEETKVHKIEIK